MSKWHASKAEILLTYTSTWNKYKINSNTTACIRINSKTTGYLRKEEPLPQEKLGGGPQGHPTPKPQPPRALAGLGGAKEAAGEEKEEWRAREKNVREL